MTILRSNTSFVRVTRSKKQQKRLSGEITYPLGSKPMKLLRTCNKTISQVKQSTNNILELGKTKGVSVFRSTKRSGSTTGLLHSTKDQ